MVGVVHSQLHPSRPFFVIRESRFLWVTYLSLSAAPKEIIIHTDATWGVQDWRSGTGPGVRGSVLGCDELSCDHVTSVKVCGIG